MPGCKPRYGYVWVGERKERFGINLEESKVVGRIFQLYVYEKRTLRNIARLLSDEGIPSPGGKAVWYDSTVRRILEDPTYTGKGSAFKYATTTGKQNGKYSSKLKPEAERLQLPSGVVPQIVDEAIFAEAQIRLRLNQVEASRNNPNPEQTLLRCGFIKCGYCKRTYVSWKKWRP